MFGRFVGQGFLTKTFSSSFSFLTGRSLKCIACGRALSLPPRAIATSLHTTPGRSGGEGVVYEVCREAGVSGKPWGNTMYQNVLVHMLARTVNIRHAHISRPPGLPASPAGVRGKTWAGYCV